MADELDYSAFPAATRLEKVAEASAANVPVNFGWVPPHQRNPEQHAADAEAKAEMPRFAIRGKVILEERRYAMWAPIRKVLGRDAHYIFQQTGSCVGAGGSNMAMGVMCAEIAIKGEGEEFRWPWWLFTYGRSRFHGGLKGRGEGSFGSAWAKAATADGLFEIDPAGQPDLPDPKIKDGWAVTPAKVELDWSDGAAIAPNWLAVGRSHKFRTAAPIRNTNEAIDALANYYGITLASNFGFSPMVPPVEGNPPVRLVRRWNATWYHQMHLDEFWDHPTLGPIFGLGNNWGPSAHGSPPSDYPAGRVYLTEALTAQILRHGDTEAFSFSFYDGYPARQLDFAAF